MRLQFASALFLGTALLSIPAHADAIDDFVLTYQTHVISFSLPSYNAVNVFVSDPQFSVGTLVTEDGVTAPGYASFRGGRFGGLSAGTVLAQGPTLYTLINVGMNTYPQYTLGTFSLFVYDPFPAMLPASVTITQETSVTPEPSTFALLTTGALGLIGSCRRRRLQV